MGRIVKDGVSYGGTGTVDPVLDQQSSNPVENKAIAKAISDINSVISEMDNSVEYSYNEQAVGTWVDGSTIYKRTYHSGALPREAEYSIPKEPGWHIGMYIKSEIIMRYTDSAYDLIWASNMGNNNIVVGTSYNVNNGVTLFYFRNPYAYSDSYVTIYYTKEADT